MSLLPLNFLLRKQPSRLARINERHWLARDLVFAHSGNGAFVFGRPVAQVARPLSSNALIGTQNPALEHSVGWVPDGTNYELYPLGVALSLPLTLSAWWFGTADATADVIVGVRRADGSAGGVALERGSTESPLCRSMTTAGGTSTATTSGYSFSTDRWAHGAAVFLSATSRQVWGDGGSSGGVNTASRAFPTDCTNVIVGASIAATAVAATSAIGGFAMPLVIARGLAEEEVARLHDEQRSNPWSLFTERPIWVPVSSGAGTNITPDTGLLSISGHAPTVTQTANQAVTPGVGTLTITGYAPTVAQTANQEVVPGVGSVTITGYAPTVTYTANQTVDPATGTITITGYAPTVQQSASGNVIPDAGTITITGHAPTVAQSNNQAIVPGAGLVVITGYAPTVAQTANQSVLPAVGSISITGYAPTVTQSAGTTITPDAGNLIITGHAPTVTQSGNQSVIPGTGSVVITGYAPTVTRTTGGGGLSAADVWQYEIEAGYTAEELMRLMSAVLAGKTTVTDLGGGNAIVTFEAVNGTKIRVTATMTGSERTAMTYDDTF